MSEINERASLFAYKRCGHKADEMSQRFRDLYDGFIAGEQQQEAIAREAWDESAKRWYVDDDRLVIADFDEWWASRKDKEAQK